MAHEVASNAAAVASIKGLMLEESLYKIKVGDMSWLPKWPIIYGFSTKPTITTPVKEMDGEAGKKKSTQVCNPNECTL